MPNFNGQLASNKIYAGLSNMIISQLVFSDNIAGTYGDLADKSKVDGTLYGDTKLYYATDVLKTHEWLNDAEAANLLAIDRAPSPEVQSIVMDVFRQIRLTTDEYLSKQAWVGEGSFGQFTAVLIGWLEDTKRVYDATLYNTFIGTNESAVGLQEQTVAIPAIADGASNVEVEAHNRLSGQAIATAMVKLINRLKDVSRDYNDYGFVRSFRPSDLVIVWNQDKAEEIRLNDLPTIFHKDIIDQLGENALPARYFGAINAVGGTTPGSNLSIRSLIEADYGNVHVFPGDLLPGGVQYQANETYTEDANILFKIMHKDSVPYMSAFRVDTSFFNARSLTTNRYLTFGHNTLEHLKNYPFITVREVRAN